MQGICNRLIMGVLYHETQYISQPITSSLTSVSEERKISTFVSGDRDSVAKIHYGISDNRVALNDIINKVQIVNQSCLGKLEEIIYDNICKPDMD